MNQVNIVMNIKSKIPYLFNNKTIINGGLFSVFSFFNRGVGFLLLMVLAKYIGPQEYGELSMFNTMVMFLGYFVGLSTAGYLSVSFFKKTEIDFKKDFTSICVITTIISLLFLIIIFFFATALSSALEVSIRFLYVGLVISFANVFVHLNLDYHRVQEKVSRYGLFSCGFALMNFFITLYLVMYQDCSWKGRIYAQLSCDICFFFIAIFCFCKARLFAFSKSWKRYKTIILWGIPLIPHLATVWLKQGIDRYIINGFYSLTDVGLFSFALNITSIIVMVGQAFNQTNSVSLYQTLSSKELSKEQKIKSLKKKEHIFIYAYLVATIIIVVSGCVFIPTVMSRYVDAIPFFIILSVFGYGQCLYFLYCNYFFYYGKTKNLMYITFCTSLIHTILSFIFTRYSIFLTCFIYVITQTIITTLVFLNSKRLLNSNLAS